VNTSAGRIVTTVTQHVAYRNVDTVSSGGFAQRLRQTDTGFTASRSTGPHGTGRASVHSWSSPIAIQATFQITDDNNFDLSATVDMTRRLTDVTNDRTVRSSTDEVDSSGLDQRVNGVTVQADGHSTENFTGQDDTGRPFRHFLASAHGFITVDRR
jgi:hypothetical protein